MDLSWSLSLLFSQMLLRDVFFYYDACFYCSHRYIFLAWRPCLLFSQMHFSIVTPVSIILTDALSIVMLVSIVPTDAFSNHDACFNVAHRCIFPSWRLFLLLFQCFSQMRFSNMTPASMLLRDAFSYHDACFYYYQRCNFLSWRLFLSFSQMHFSIMTPVSMLLRDAFSYHDACFYYSQRCIFL